MDNKNIFASNLNKYMEESQKTRKDLAEALGVSYYTITDWVKGKKYPRMDKVEMLANYFGVLKSDLIEEKDQEDIEKPAIADGLTENHKKLIDFAESLSEEQAVKVLKLMQSILAFDE